MSYTPGLLVTAATRHRVRRELSLPGEVLVEVGQTVAATDTVARTRLPGEVYPINLKARLGVSPADVPKCLQVAVGQPIEPGQVLARSPGLFGWFRRECRAEVAGTVESVSQVTGQAIVRGPEQPVEVAAYLAGTVVEVTPTLGCTIEADAAIVQGIFGIGGEAFGPIRPIATDPAATLAPSDIPEDASGTVLIGGGRASIGLIRAAIDAGASALVAGGIDDADLRDLLGYDLGVAVTGTERLGLTLVFTEGFGEIAMASRTFDLLGSLAGRQAAVNGTTQIRAGVLRPEIVVPVEAAAAAETTAAGELAIGAPVRIIRDPYFGQLGTVGDLPPEPAMLASESRARVLVVQTGTGESITVPRANVELIET